MSYPVLCILSWKGGKSMKRILIIVLGLIFIILHLSSCVQRGFDNSPARQNNTQWISNDNKMLSNYEQYIHIIESTIEAKTKSDLEFYKNLEKTFFENLEGLELTALLFSTGNDIIYLLK